MFWYIFSFLLSPASPPSVPSQHYPHTTAPGAVAPGAVLIPFPYNSTTFVATFSQNARSCSTKRIVG